MVMLYKTKPLKKRRSEKRELFIRKIRASLLFIAGFALGFVISHLMFSSSQQGKGISPLETPSLHISFHSKGQYKDRITYPLQSVRLSLLSKAIGDKHALQAKVYKEAS